MTGCPQQAQIQKGVQFSFSCLWSLCDFSVWLRSSHSILSPHGAIESNKMYILNMTVKNFTFAKMLKIMNNYIPALMQIFDVKAKMLLFNINYLAKKCLYSKIQDYCSLKFTKTTNCLLIKFYFW